MRITNSRLIALAIGLLFNTQSALATQPALPEQFGAIKEFLLDTVAESQHHGAAATYALLHENLAEFKRLKATVEQAPHIDQVIDELSAGLATIATNFEQAASLRGAYKAHTSNSDQQLLQKRNQTKQAIESLNQRIARVDAELKQAQQALPVARTSTDREKHQITISANLSVLHSLNAQIEIWRRFESTQQRLAESLQQSAERTDFLLFVLEKNAQVYREAANTAQLRRDAHLALSNLAALGGIESSLTDLAASWRAVDQLVNEIGSEAFRYDVGS
jgi:chromosome segregation ATPase